MRIQILPSSAVPFEEPKVAMTPEPASPSSAENLSAAQKQVSLAGKCLQLNSRRREQLACPQPCADAPSCACNTAELGPSSAGLSAKLHGKRFAVEPVDHSHKSRRQKAQCVILDLAVDCGSVLLCRLLSERWCASDLRSVQTRRKERSFKKLPH